MVDAAEREIEDTFGPAPLRVLKVPHHGSLTSSTEPFITRLHPTVAVISAGRGNAFGHPAPAVVSRYESHGASIYRTDQDGAVTIDTDGHELAVSTVTGRTAYWPPSNALHEETKSQESHEGYQGGR